MVYVVFNRHHTLEVFGTREAAEKFVERNKKYVPQLFIYKLPVREE